MNRHWNIAFMAMLMFGVLLSAAYVPQALASDITVFGKTYTRATQKPQVFVDTFTLSQPDNEFVLTVKNGKDGKFRVSAALIWINGKQVVGVSDFNNQVDLITRDVVLKAANEIKVELRSKPGDFITVNIIGLNINTPPVADAGRDQTALAGEAVTLDGSGSTDADMDPLTYSWSFASRPAGSAAALINPLTVNPTFQIDKPGQYAVQLVVNDGEADSAPDTVAIATINSPPTAEAGPDQSVHAGNLVRLNGSGSSDVDGDGLTFSWSFAEKPQGSASVLSGVNTVEPTFVSDLPGTYTVRLVVNDGHVNSVPDTVAITTTNTRPVADAGPDQSVVLGAMVTLDGSGSTDVDGDPLLYFWTLTEKPAGSAALLTDAAAVKPTFMADRPGMYVVHLFVNDGLADSGQDTVVISTINSVPAAEAGPGQSVFVGDTVTLDGSGSHDADGDALTYFWSLAVRPSGSAAALSDSSAVKPTFTADKPGTYVAQLIVNDGKADSAPDTVTITTVNSQPVSDAGPDQTTYVTQTVTLDGSGSSDVDGDALTYRWSLSSTPAGSSAVLSDSASVKPTFYVDKFGTYVVQLIVNDGTVDSAPDTVTVTTGNTAPVADAGSDQTAHVTQTVTLDGSGSSDVDGNLLTFSWSLTTRPGGSAAALSDATAVKPAFTVDKSGTYVAQLIVNDGTVDSAPDTVTVSTQNTAPVASAGPDQTVSRAETVQLDGSGSSDVDGDALSYSWSFSSLPPGSAASLVSPLSVNPTFVTDVRGDYVIQLIVSDGMVESTPDTVTITTSNSKPVARAGENQSVIVGATVTLDGSASSDADGDPLSYSWSIIAKPGGSAAELSSPKSVQPSFTPDLIGTYVIQLIVHDGIEGSDPDSVTIEVSVQPNRAPVAVNDGYGTDEDAALLVGAGMGVLANDGDPDANAIAALLVGNVAHGALTFNGDGSFSYTPDPNYHGVDSFSYSATDGLLSSNTATVSIAVRSVNDAPIADAGENQNVATGATVQLNGSLSSDPDGDALTYQWALTSKPDGSAAILSDASIVNPTFVADKAGVYEASLIVNDGTVDSVPDTAAIDAISVNQQPLATDISVSISGDTPATIVLRASDPDDDPLAITPSDPSHGTLSGTAPLLTYTPELNYIGSDSFTYRVSDGKGGTAVGMVSINICGSGIGLMAYYPFHNNAGDESGNANSGTVYGAAPTANRVGKVYSAYGFDGVDDFIQVPSSNLSLPGSFTFSAWVRNLDNSFADGTRNHIITLSQSNSLDLDPTYRYCFRISPRYPFQYAVTSTNTFADNNYHHVTGVYDYENSVIKIYVNGKLEGTAPVSGSIVVYAGAAFTIGDYEGATGYYAWKGAIDEVRIYNRAISEYEIQQLASGCCSTSTSNQSPRITSMPLTVGGTGYLYSYQVIANDPDGDTLTFSIPSAPAGMAIDSTGLIRWTPDTASDFRVSVQVADPFGGMDTQNYWIRTSDANSTAINHAPIAHAGDDFTMDEGEQDQLDGSHSFDADGNPLTYEWTQVAGPAVRFDGATVQKPRFVAPQVDKNTVLTFEVAVNDGDMDSAPARVNVMVLNTDIWPDGSGMVVNCNMDGAGSLKAAVDYANTHPGTRITFSIPDTEPCYEVNTPGVWTLKTPSRVVGMYLHGILLEGEGTLFDGYSQADNQGDRNPYGPEIEIDESGITKAPFQVIGSNVVVRGTVFNRNAGMTGADAGIYISAGENVVISGNYIGTDATGTQPIGTGTIGGGDENTGGGGIVVQHDNLDYTKVPIVRHLRIGGSRPGEGNLFNLHPFQSIRTMYPYYTFPPHDIFGPITIQGNTFGLDRSGTRIFDWHYGDVTPALWSNAITIGAGKDILIGGVTAGSRNVMAGQNSQIVIEGNRELGSVTIQGNYLGTDVTGTVNLNPNNSQSIAIQSVGDPAGNPSPDGPEILIGGGIPGAGNLFAEGNSARTERISIKAYDPWSNNPPIRIQGNLFGTDVTGTRDLNTTGFPAGGISITGGRVLIGGTEPGEGNVFGGLGKSAVEVGGDKWIWEQGHQSLIEVKGNRIGVGADGFTPIPNQIGITAGTDYPLVIGGTQPGAGNIIANSIGHGIELGWLARVMGNSIYGNGGKGINRGYQNDPGDANYVSPTYAQNYPVIDIVEVIDGLTYVNGVLDTPNPEQCLIEIFANRTADPSGHGEGEQWVAELYPNADGTFQVAIPQDLTGRYLAATATRMTGLLNSSEFSPAVLGGASSAVNLPPVISSSPVKDAITESAYSYQVAASDPEGRPLRYSLALAPDGMAIDAVGLISWIPTIQQAGKQVATVVVYDPEGLYASQNFVILTEPLVDVIDPVISPSLPLGLTISTPYQVTGTICDSHIVGYSIEVAASGTDSFVLMSSGNSCVENGVLGTIDPTRLTNGTYVVRFTAWDESGNLSVFNSIDPVEVKGKLKIGQFSLAFQDISIPVSGIPINVVRSYNSFNKKQGDFGTGWDMALGTGAKVQVTRTLGTDWRAEEDFWWQEGPVGGSWSYKLATDRIPKVLVTYADGKQDRFEFKPDFFRSAAPPYPALDPRYVSAIYRPLEGTTSTLEAVADTDLFLIDDGLYDTDVEPYNPVEFKLTTADGMVLILSKIEGLKSITDRNGNTVTFSPTGIAHSAGLSINMQRDFKNRITKITDPMGQSVGYSYNANDDLASFMDQAGNVTKYGYDADHNLTSIIDPRGIEILKVAYDAEGRMIGTLDGLGNPTEITHDTENAIEYVKDRRGNTTSYEYDMDGNVIAETDPLGNVTRFTYDTNGNQLSKTDPLGNIWTWTYDDKDNKLSETDPLGNTKLWTYNSTGDVLSATDANGHTEANIYDSLGNLITKSYRSGATFTFTYDSAGNVVSLTAPDGKVTQIQNDGRGKILELIDPIGRTKSYSYDGNGNRTSESTTRTTEGGPIAVNYASQYNNLNKPVLYIDPEGKQITLEYDSTGRLVAKVDRNGNRYEYSYNANGHHVNTRYQDTTEKTFTVDANGNRLSETDRAGRTTQYENDANNRRIRTVFADGRSKQFEYDAAGRVSAEIDENGHRTEYGYDSAERRTSIIDAAGNQTRFTYDGEGNQLSVTDPNGHTTSFEYNALNQLVKTTFPDGSFTTATYDILGRTTSETDQAGIVTRFEHDPVGRLTRVIDPLGGEMTYEYDEIDNKVSQTDPNGHTTRWQFDGLGRVLKRILPLGMQEIFTYDGRGNMLTKTTFKGETIAFTYNGDNRVTSISYPDGSSKTFTYNPTGTRKTATDGGGTINYSHDLRDRVTSVVNPGGKAVAYTYDAKGNKSSVTTSSGTFAYTFDALDRPSTVIDASGGITDHEYDRAGNLLITRLPNGITTTRSYNSLNRLLELESRTSDGGLLASYVYTLAPNGNRTRVVEGDGRAVDYTYDPQSRLLQEEINDPSSGSRTIAYTYDAFGNRLTKNDSLDGLTSYTFDENDRLLTENAPGGTTTYSYDQNGNLVSKAKSGNSTVYSYSPDNRLLGMNSGSMQMQYAYDPDGLRIHSVKDETTIVNHLLDKVLPYAQVIQESDETGTELASYVYGRGLISMKRPETGMRYYTSDGLGSTRQLTNSVEATTDSYDYDAFGNSLQSTGATLNGHLFAGEQFDTEIGMYYLRARYYDPQTDRFAEADAAAGNEFRPLSLNKYIYAEANPVMNIDPSGLMSLIESSYVSNAQGNLRAGQMVHYRSGFIAQKVTRAIRLAFILGGLGLGGYGIYSISGGGDTPPQEIPLEKIITRADAMSQVEIDQ